MRTELTAAEQAREARATARAEAARAKALRPWFRKKRFVLGGIVGLLAIGSLATSGGDSGGAGETLTQNTASAAETGDAGSTATGDAADQASAEPGPSEPGPVATAGFTTYQALNETWASVGVVLTGLSGGSQELTITLLDAAGTPLATTSEYVGSDGGGGEVLVSARFIDNVPTAASVRVDVSDASMFADAQPFPVQVTGHHFDGNFWSVTGTAVNDRSENIELGRVTCVAFRSGVPVGGVTTHVDTIVPTATIAWDARETFDPGADAVRCQGESA